MRFACQKSLRLGASTAILMGGVSLVLGASAASAQEVDDPTEASEVVVTGTRIRGVAPVGSSVISAGRMEIEASGASNNADFLRKVPQVLAFGGSDERAGGADFQGAALNNTWAKSVNLRGLGVGSTLNLVNGHRVPPMGPASDLFDSESIPTIAIQRIEVVADGGSAIYGSDAMSGVVNYIMRDPFDGAETSARYGWADGREDWQFAGIIGATWSDGGIVLAAERAHRDPLSAADRPNLYNDDYSALGGPPLPASGIPGNVLIGGVSYAIPTGQANSLTLGELGAAGSINRLSGWAGTQGLPESDVQSYSMKFEQHLGDAIRIYGDALYSRRDFSIYMIALRSPNLTVPNTNPYSPCNPAAVQTNSQGIVCPAGGIGVQYNFLGDIGGNLHEGWESVQDGVLGAEIELPGDWSLNAFVNAGSSANRTRDFNRSTRVARLNQVLAGPVGAIPAFNPFCDGTPGCNSPVTLDYALQRLYNAYSYERRNISGNLSGPLFSLPGGAARLAIGGEFTRDEYVTWNGNDATGAFVEVRAPSPPREVKSAFAELYIPLIGESNAGALGQSLELVIAGRFDDYNDFGETTNPKVGINWVPVEGLKVHGSYGTSFRAPPLQAMNPGAASALFTQSFASTALSPGIGYTGPAGTLLASFALGGNADLQPEEADTYTFGVDYEPDFAPGLRLSATYYNIEYTNKLDFPTFNAGLPASISNAFFAPFVLRNPRFFNTGLTVSQADFDAIFNALLNSTPQPAASPFDTAFRLPLGPPVSPTTSIAIVDARRNNTGIINTDGLDLTASYSHDFDWGTLRLGGIATYVLNYDTSVTPGAPIMDELNTFAGPMQFRGRGDIGVDIGDFSGTLFVNYVNSYDVARRYLPPTASSQFESVDSYMTFDLSLIYRLGETPSYEPLQNVTFNVAVQNLFDEDPPLVLNSTTSTNFGGIMFDPANASPLGRLISFQISKAW